MSIDIENADTTATVHSSDPRFEQYGHSVHDMVLEEDLVVLNFTCTDGKGNEVPVHPVGFIRLLKGSHVNGPLIFADDLAAFKATAKNADKFAILNAGFQDVKMPDGSTVKKQLAMIVTEAEGCKNPIRIVPVPETTSTTGGSTETTQGGGHDTTSTPNHNTTTTRRGTTVPGKPPGTHPPEEVATTVGPEKPTPYAPTTYTVKPATTSSTAKYVTSSPPTTHGEVTPDPSNPDRS